MKMVWSISERTLTWLELVSVLRTLESLLTLLTMRVDNYQKTPIYAENLARCDSYCMLNLPMVKHTRQSIYLIVNILKKPPIFLLD